MPVNGHFATMHVNTNVDQYSGKLSYLRTICFLFFEKDKFYWEKNLGKKKERKKIDGKIKVKKKLEKK